MSLLIAFVALYLIVSRIALPRVGGVIDARQDAIEGDLAEAQKLKDQSDAALKSYENELASARSRAQAIGTETREKLNAASEAERKTLEEQLSVKLAEAEKTIASTREAAMSNVRGIAADAAAAIVQRLTGVRPTTVGQQRRRCVVEGIIDHVRRTEFWVAVGFVILMGVFVYIGVHRTVLTALDHRRERIKSELDDARRLKDEAAKLLAEYKARQRQRRARGTGHHYLGKGRGRTHRRRSQDQNGRFCGAADQDRREQDRAGRSPGDRRRPRGGGQGRGHRSLHDPVAIGQGRDRR